MNDVVEYAGLASLAAALGVGGQSLTMHVVPKIPGGASVQTAVTCAYVLGAVGIWAKWAFADGDH